MKLPFELGRRRERKPLSNNVTSELILTLIHKFSAGDYEIVNGYISIESHIPKGKLSAIEQHDVAKRIRKHYAGRFAEIKLDTNDTGNTTYITLRLRRRMGIPE